MPNPLTPPGHEPEPNKPGFLCRISGQVQECPCRHSTCQDEPERPVTPDGVRLIRADEICGPGERPIHPLLANYLVACFKFALGRPDANEFADALLDELEGRTHVL